MCEFCVKHGEGKKWYLNAKNYSYDLLSDIKRRRFIKHTGYWVDNLYKKKFPLIKTLFNRVPVARNLLKKAFKNWMLYKHWGQVIPIEDVEKILSFTNSITRIPCVCRKITKGTEERLCFLISLAPDKIGVADIVDQSFLGGPDIAKFEKVEVRWAISFMKENERKGQMHTIWTFKAPFIGALCNCDFKTGCIPMRMYKEFVPPIFRAEYIGEIDEKTCIACKECMKLCPFDAIEVDKATKKMKINKEKCYGCGICRSVCKKQVITLISRTSVSEVANLW